MCERGSSFLRLEKCTDFLQVRTGCEKQACLQSLIRVTPFSAWNDHDMMEAIAQNRLLINLPQERPVDTTVDITVRAENVHSIKVLLILHKVIKIGIQEKDEQGEI